MFRPFSAIFREVFIKEKYLNGYLYDKLAMLAFKYKHWNGKKKEIKRHSTMCFVIVII